MKEISRLIGSAEQAKSSRFEPTYQGMEEALFSAAGGMPAHHPARGMENSSARGYLVSRLNQAKAQAKSRWPSLLPDIPPRGADRRRFTPVQCAAIFRIFESYMDEIDSTGEPTLRATYLSAGCGISPETIDQAFRLVWSDGAIFNAMADLDSAYGQDASS